MSRADVLRWRDPILRYCLPARVPPSLVCAVMDAETGGLHWRPDGSVVVSPAGARGVMQLIPGTAITLRVDPDLPEENIRGGVLYLADMAHSFGNWLLAIAAYNAGPGAVNKYGGVPPFDETIAYVKKVTEGLLLYLDMDAEWIWGADSEHAPETGTHREGYSNVLGVANLRKQLGEDASAVLGNLRKLADHAIAVLERAK